MAAVLKRMKLWAWIVVSQPVCTLRIDRFLWKRLAHRLDLPTRWQAAMEKVMPHHSFFIAVPYRPAFTNSLDTELTYIKLAFAVANCFYFHNDTVRYRFTIERIGQYLEHAIKSEPEIAEGSLWADYLHHDGTVQSILGRPEVAVRQNARALQVFQKNPGAVPDKLSTEACTICCRLETLTSPEGYLAESFDERLMSISLSLAGLRSDAGNMEERRDIATRRFYAEMLRCKAQARTASPDLAILDNALYNARECFKELDGGEDSPAYRATLLFYEAFVSKYKNEPIDVTKRKYETALEQFSRRSTPAVCLLRIPEEVATELANYSKNPRLSPNKEIEELKLRETGKFKRFIVSSLGSAMIVGAAWLTMESRVPQTFQHNWYAVLAIASLLIGLAVFRETRKVEEGLQKLVAPSIVDQGKVLYHILFTLAIAAGAEQAVHSLPH